MLSKKFIKAVQYASEAHLGQTRKFDNSPYIAHPLEVARLVQEALHYVDITNERKGEVIIAALFHDVLEDTDITEQEMRDQWGTLITKLVVEVTNHKFEDKSIPRAEKFAVNLKKLKKISYEAQIIKACDIIHNLSDIVEQNPRFALTYLTEKRKVAEVLTDLPPTLEADLNKIILDGFEKVAYHYANKDKGSEEKEKLSQS